MRIALINEYFPPFAPGGAEWSGLEFGRALAARGHAVLVITPNYGAPRRETIGGLEIARFPFPARLRGRRTLPLRWLASPLFYLWSAVAIIFYAMQFRADVLHAQNKYSLPGTWLASRFLRRPMVGTVRDTLLACPFGRCFMLYDQVPAGCRTGPLWTLCRDEHIIKYVRPSTPLHWLKAHLTASYLRLDLRLRQWVLRHTDGVITVSHGIRRLYVQAGIVLGKRSRVIYNIPPNPAQASGPVDESLLRERYRLDNGPIVLYGGKFSPGKGTGDLVVAAHQVISRVPDAQFVFAGGSDLPGANASYVHAVGKVPNQDFLGLCALAKVVVVPSVWPEPLSRVALEAIAFGVPVVATAVGGSPEIVAHEVNGLLVPKSAPGALADAISILLLDEEHRLRLGKAGRIIAAQRFAADSVVDQHVAFYQDICRSS